MVKSIALFIPSARGGGVEKMAIQLANEFSDRSIKVDLVLGIAKGPNLTSVGDNVRVINLNAPRLRTGVAKLRRYISEESPDVLFSRMPHAIVVTEIALIGLKRRPVHIGSFHNMPSSRAANAGFADKLRRFINFWIQKILFARTQHLIGVSEGVVNAFKKRFGLGDHQISVIHNPIPVDRIHKASLEPNAHPWFSKPEPVLVAIGRLTPQKGFDVLLKAFRIVRDKTDLKLIILGEGELREELEDLRRTLGLEADVDMPGYQSNPYSFIGHSQLFVMSSNWEGFGNVIVESLAAGTPVVSTNCLSGPAEILGNGKWGLLTPVGNPELLAHNILNAIKSTPDTEALLDRAREFDVSKIVGRYLSLANELHKKHDSLNKRPLKD